MPGGLRVWNQLDLSRLDRYKGLVSPDGALAGSPIVNEWTCLDQAGASLGWVCLEVFCIFQDKAWRVSKRTTEAIYLGAEPLCGRP